MYTSAHPFWFLSFTRVGLGLFVAVFLWAVPLAHAQQQTIIRDSEIEGILTRWARPLIETAHLDPQAVRLIIVQSPEVNAFVAGGQNIFLYSGLLLKTTRPEEVMGVIAHELGHIAGGHLVRGAAEMERASYEVILGAIVGIGAAAATGQGDVGTAILGGASGLAQRRFLAFSRTQENAADQAALTFMRGAQINPEGLYSFMEKLAGQELLPTSQQNEYVRTHPLTRDRLETIQAGIADSPLRNRATPDLWAQDHARMRAKLLGFLQPQQVNWTYPHEDKSVNAAYARAIAAYRQNLVDDALAQMRRLMDREPNNPYFHELYGQMLFDFGRAREAVAPYARAVELAPQAALIKLGYAQALLEQPRAPLSDVRQARDLLEQVRLVEPRMTRVYRLLATVDGRLGQDSAAQGWLAEEAFLQARYDESRRLATLAEDRLAVGSPARQRMRDLLDQLDRVKKAKDR